MNSLMDKMGGSDLERPEQRLMRMNRSLRTLSAVNRLITQSRDPQQLPQQICRAIAEQAGYVGVWVGETTTTNLPLRQLACAGSACDTDPDTLAFAMAERDPLSTHDPSPLLMVLQRGERYLISNLADATEPMGQWRQQLLQQGVTGCVVLPLAVGDECSTLLAIHTNDGIPFDSAELSLLDELATDVSYALNRLRQQMIDDTQLQLRHRAIEATCNGIMIADARAPGAPLIYVNPAFTRITGYSSAQVLGRSPSLLHAGIDDQPELERLQHAIQHHRDGVVVVRNRRADGSEFWNELHISPVYDDTGEVTHFVGVINDVTLQHRYEEERTQRAYHDQLTGLPNRHLMHDRLTQALHYARRSHGHVTVLLLNLDHFKLINDGLGLQLSDQILIAAAHRLAALISEPDTVSRYRGDEFVLVLPQQGDSAAITPFATQLLKALAEPINESGHTLRITASIGVSLYPRDGDNADSLLRSADAAVRRAKELGRNNVQYYTDALNSRVSQQMQLSERLHQAIAKDELRLFYQPQIDLGSGRVTGMEALLRWQVDEQTLLPPGEFIPLAESTGLIVPIGEWVLQQASQQARAWQEQGLPALTMAVHIAPLQLLQSDLVPRVEHIIRRSGIDPARLELELTETAVMSRPEEIQRLLERFKAIGVRLALDNFGTGHSSLGYLSRLPFDTLKIDHSFVRELANNPHHATIVATIIGMAENLNLRVIAEGVETEAQAAFLTKHRCGGIQGYLFSPPLPADQIAPLLRDSRTLPVSGSDSEEPSPTLLILDDEVNITRSLYRLLRRDYRVLCANDPDTAFDLLALNAVQVIISDQRMPVMSGTEFFSRVKELYPDVVRIILSGYTDMQTITDAVNNGWIYKFLTKPWDDDNLRRHLHDAFRHYRRQRRLESD